MTATVSTLVTPKGSKNPKYIFVKDAPSDLEGITREPFSGSYAMYLNLWLRILKVSKDEVYTTFASKVRLADLGRVTERQITSLKREIGKYNPQAIFLVGPEVTKALLPNIDTFSPNYRVYMQEDQYFIKMWTPEFLQSNPSESRKTEEFLQKLSEVDWS